MDVFTVFKGVWINLSVLFAYKIGEFPVGRISLAVLFFLILFVLLVAFHNVLLRNLGKLAKKTKSELDDTVVAALMDVGKPLFATISAYAAARLFGIGGLSLRLLWYLLFIVITYSAVRFLQRIISYFTNAEIAKKSKQGDEAQTASIARLLTGTINLTIWIIAILFIISNFGFNITSLIAGLGIGGLAVALALQGVFGDLFATLSIFFDKPFKVGDFIIVGNDMGSVEHIGLKSTRVKTLQGQQLTISNKELTNSRINNYARMETRRIVFSFGIKYETKNQKVRKVPEIVKTMFSKMKNTKFDRVHFKELGPYSLNYEVVYYVLSADYNIYMDCQQEANLMLKEALEAEGVEFAYPTQAIQINKG